MFFRIREQDQDGGTSKDSSQVDDEDVAIRAVRLCDVIPVFLFSSLSVGCKHGTFMGNDSRE